MCPITLDIMKDPVIFVDGYTYDRIAIEEYLKKSGVSPMTRQPMTIEQAIPNRALKDQIDDFLAKKEASAKNQKPMAKNNLKDLMSQYDVDTKVHPSPDKIDIQVNPVVVYEDSLNWEPEWKKCYPEPLYDDMVDLMNFHRLAENEQLIYSSDVRKMNSYKWRQNWKVFITNLAYYLYRPKSMFTELYFKRFDALDIKGITKNFKTGSVQFVIHNS